jgi:hypothetical protein
MLSKPSKHDPEAGGVVPSSDSEGITNDDMNLWNDASSFCLDRRGEDDV